ncbi:hypothetical protein BN59_02812 [Legionella massiliensis]|uniref:Uncharacterized protein n=1 Tax=Legionella massiliensis TaxID=1034943 RepID=A0A078KZT4_9GAMM|nr:hypothetical protein [Legionella massiliensis]CDZ78502.1 hypothetical protein BN59_02812 [Legionella massiliensis]CEE14240.1 hypothetical protein BN1094_02812 [Legionella massiliensis]
MLQLVSQKDIEARLIANSINSLGNLALHGKLTGSFDAKDLKPLLERLVTLKDIDPQAIANILTSLGNLAINGKLTGSFEAKDLSLLLQPFSTFAAKDIQPRQLGNSLNGIGKLAIKGRLIGQLPAETIDMLLNLLLSSPLLSSMDISNAVNNLGRLFKAGSLRTLSEGRSTRS